MIIRPWSKWFWDDYHSDTRELTAASRGLWVDCLRLQWIKAQSVGHHPGFWTSRVDRMPSALAATPDQVIDFFEELAINRVGILIAHGPTCPPVCDIEAHVTRLCCDAEAHVTPESCDMTPFVTRTIGGYVTIASRRLWQEWEALEGQAERKRRSRQTTQKTGDGSPSPDTTLPEECDIPPRVTPESRDTPRDIDPSLSRAKKLLEESESESESPPKPPPRGERRGARSSGGADRPSRPHQDPDQFMRNRLAEEQEAARGRHLMAMAEAGVPEVDTSQDPGPEAPLRDRVLFHLRDVEPLHGFIAGHARFTLDADQATIYAPAQAYTHIQRQLEYRAVAIRLQKAIDTATGTQGMSWRVAKETS